MRSLDTRIQKCLENKIFGYVITALFILTPLISAILFCAMDGRLISDIYIPLGGWSDEITYYKQVESVLSHGIPRGYFGYNQSRAVIGPFACWGFLPLIPYVIWGFLFGWTYVSPIYANIFFCMMAFAFLYFLLRPTKKWCLSFSAFWILFKYLNRHVLSGMVEASVLQQIMFIAVIGECLLSEKVRSHINMTKKKENILIVVCTILIFLLTIVRPYYAVFFLIPFWAVIRNKSKVGIVSIPVVGLFSIVCYALYRKYICAAYFKDAILIDEMIGESVSGILTHIVSDVVELGRYIWYALRYHDVVGWYYLLFFMQMGIMLFVCIYKLYKKQSVPKMYVVALVGNVLILLSIILLYDLIVGGRHLIALIVVNTVLLLVETHIGISGVMCSVLILCTLLSWNREVLPYIEDDYALWLDSLKQICAEKLEVTDEISYDNVVGMPVSDRNREDQSIEAVTYYGLLFAMPSGMGVSLDFASFYDDPDNIKAKYILVHPDGMIRLTLEEIGMKPVVEMEELMIYARE